MCDVELIIVWSISLSLFLFSVITSFHSLNSFCGMMLTIIAKTDWRVYFFWYIRWKQKSFHCRTDTAISCYFKEDIALQIMAGTFLTINNYMWFCFVLFLCSVFTSLILLKIWMRETHKHSLTHNIKGPKESSGSISNKWLFILHFLLFFYFNLHPRTCLARERKREVERENPIGCLP